MIWVYGVFGTLFSWLLSHKVATHLLVSAPILSIDLIKFLDYFLQSPEARREWESLPPVKL